MRPSAATAPTPDGMTGFFQQRELSHLDFQMRYIFAEFRIWFYITFKVESALRVRGFCFAIGIEAGPASPIAFV